MKKIVAVLLLFLYVMPSMGINLWVHYCNGFVSSVSFGFDDVKKCSCNGNTMKKNCCQDKELSFQLNDDQNKSPLFVLNIAKSVDTQPEFVLANDFQNSQVFASASTSFILWHHPPEEIKQPLFVLHRVFRI
jgi:hypothetical protein